MKSVLHWLALLALPCVVYAGDIKLRSGLVLREARIVQISEKLVTIVHQGGSMGVDPAEVDLEVLARAHLELEDEIAGRAQRAAAAAANAEERMARIEALKAEQAKPAPAAGGNRSGAAQTVQGKASASAGPGKAARPTVNPSARVLQLKAAFPPKSVGTANVYVPRNGADARPYIVSSSVTNLPNSGDVSTPKVKSRDKGRIEPFTYDVPAVDTWDWYRGMLRTTTLDALPRTLQMIEKRLAEDIQKAQATSRGSAIRSAAQAKHTLVWFDKALRPHLNEWRALLP